MNGRLTIPAVVLSALLSAGCSQIATRVVQKVGDDLTRTSELAAKYGRPEVKQCADFMVASINDFRAMNDKLAALEAEPTDGVISDVFKKALIADMIKSQMTTINQDAFQKGFEDNCSAVSGKIMFAIAKDAAKLIPFKP